MFGRENLVRNLSNFAQDVVRRVTVSCEIIQAKVSNFAKANHPYTDRTGNLTKSVMPGRITIENTSITAEVRAGDKFAEYASYVELGTSRSRPYPFLFPALMAHKAEFRGVIQNAVRESKP